MTPGSSTVSITNNQTVVAITSPANNYLTTSSNLTVRGTVKGTWRRTRLRTNVQVTVNNNAPATATLGALNSSGVLIPVNGGVEEVAQESFAWSITNVTLVPGANVITAQSISVQGTNLETASFPATHTVFYATNAAVAPGEVDG